MPGYIKTTHHLFNKSSSFFICSFKKNLLGLLFVAVHRFLSAHMIDDGLHSQQMWGFSFPNAGVSNPTLPLQVMFLAPGNA